jgi:hypothetical protein
MTRRVVVPEVVRLSLSEGDWIEVKMELTRGEADTIRNQMIKGIRPPGPEQPTIGYDLDIGGWERATVEAYLVDWSIKGLDDKVIDIQSEAKKRSALRNVITQETFAEILDAISQHKERVALAKKPMEIGSPTSAPISG